MKRIGLELALAGLLCTSPAFAQDLRSRAQQLEATALSVPKQISFPAAEVVRPGNGPLFVYLAEHGREARVRVGALLAMGVLYQGKIHGTHSYENLPYLPQIPDNEVRRVTLLCLRDRDDWVRKKAWGVSKAFLELTPPDPEVVRFIAQTMPRLTDVGWESRYATGACWYLSMPEQTIERSMLELARKTSHWDCMANIYQQLTEHPKIYPHYRDEFYKLFLSKLKNPDPLFRGLATNPLVAMAGEADRAELIQSLLPLLKDPSPFVRSRAVQALGKLKDQQVLPQILALLDDHSNNHGGPNEDGSPHKTVRDAALRALNDLTQGSKTPFVYALQSSNLNAVYPSSVLQTVASEAARAHQMFPSGR